MGLAALLSEQSRILMQNYEGINSRRKVQADRSTYLTAYKGSG